MWNTCPHRTQTWRLYHMTHNSSSLTLLSSLAFFSKRSHRALQTFRSWQSCASLEVVWQLQETRQIRRTFSCGSVMYSFNFSSLFSLSFKNKRQRVRDASLRDTTCLKWNITWYSWFSGLSDSTLRSWLSSQACGASSGGALFSSVSFWSKWSRWSLHPRKTRQRNTWSEGWQTVTKEQLLITLNIINYYIIYISLRLSVSL